MYTFTTYSPQIPCCQIEMVVEDLTVRVERLEDRLLNIEQNQLLILEKFKWFEEYQFPPTPTTAAVLRIPLTTGSGPSSWLSSTECHTFLHRGTWITSDYTSQTY